MYACFSAAGFSAQSVFPTVAVTWCDSAGCCGWPWRWQRQKPRQGLLSLAAALAVVCLREQQPIIWLGSLLTKFGRFSKAQPRRLEC